MVELQRNATVVRRWWYLLLGAALIGGIVAYGLTKVLVKRQYEGTAIIAMAPAPSTPSGLYVTMLSAAADAQLVPTLATARAAAASVPGTSPIALERAITSSTSPEQQLLFVHVRWPSPGTAIKLTNAVARAYVGMERARLAERYDIVHRGIVAEEIHLQSLLGHVTGHSTADDWLRSQYANSASGVYQQDTAARIEARAQQASLQIAQPATDAPAVGSKPAVNAAIGAILGLLLALLAAYFATDNYDAPVEGDLRPVLTKVGD